LLPCVLKALFCGDIPVCPIKSLVYAKYAAVTLYSFVYSKRQTINNNTTILNNQQEKKAREKAAVSASIKSVF